MSLPADIAEYNLGLSASDKTLAEALCASIAKALPLAKGKVWHGHPVWFIDGNPVVGYSIKKAGLEVLFWSGQAFKTSGLRAIGKFQAAGILATLDSDFEKLFADCLREAALVQWDYKNLPKNRKLVKLTNF